MVLLPSGSLYAAVVTWRSVSLRTCCHYMCSPDEKTTSEQCDYKVSGLAVYGTGGALEYGSQNALTSRRRAQKRRAFPVTGTSATPPL